ncbi:MAG TPA: PPC domain-containing DNA-binding protein [Pyrinomonadaceae bacterium]|jgi:predicted DNA-binding protein with PD1-like motif|nr:PPC domain-containing DNA-binding protein [Pyrinomonadaceae bacterium]
MKHLISKTLLLCLTALAVLVLNLNARAQTIRSQRQSFESAQTEHLRILALRLKPGQDLRQQLESFVKEQGIKAGFLITTVGSLRQASIRLADQSAATDFTGKFEIVSLVGTLGQDGVHLHISISDSAGKTIGGHLVAGCLIYTTAEIVIGEAEGLTFARELDAETGYQELRIRKKSRSRRR